MQELSKYMARNNIKIEIVRGQDLSTREVGSGSTLADVLGEINEPVGVFGELKAPDYILQDGDRIEFYQPLLIDPKDARRARAKKKQKTKKRKRE